MEIKGNMQVALQELIDRQLTIVTALQHKLSDEEQKLLMLLRQTDQPEVKRRG